MCCGLRRKQNFGYELSYIAYKNFKLFRQPEAY